MLAERGPVSSAVGPGAGAAGADLDGVAGTSDRPDLADQVGGTPNPHELDPQDGLRSRPEPYGAELAAAEATNCWRGVAVSGLTNAGVAGDDALVDALDTAGRGDALDDAAALGDALDAAALGRAGLDDGEAGCGRKPELVARPPSCRARNDGLPRLEQA